MVGRIVEAEKVGGDDRILPAVPYLRRLVAAFHAGGIDPREIGCDRSDCPGGQRGGLINGRGKSLALELGGTVEPHFGGNNHIAKRHVLTDTAAGAGGNEELGFHRRGEFGHELANRSMRTVIVEMQTRLEKQYLGLTDRARKIEPEALIIARHLGALVIERRVAAGNEGDIIGYAMTIFVPSRRQIVRHKHGRKRRRLGRSPCHYDRVVSGEFAQIVSRGGRWFGARWGG